MLRRLIILLIIVLVLGAIIAGVAHAVLKSDTPRRIAIDQIEAITGLKTEIDSVELSWGGRAHVTGLKLTAPLEDEPFVSIDAATAELSPLLLVAVTQNPGLEHVTVDGLELALRQHDDGQWNLLQILDRFEGEGDGGPAGQPPKIELTNSVVTVEDNQGRRTRLDEITLTGEPVGAAAFMFDAAAKPGLAASGRIDLRGSQRHRIDFNVEGVRALAHDWLAELDLPEGDLAVAGNWSGRLSDGDVLGQLAINSLHVGPLSGHGILGISAGADDVEVTVEHWLASLEDERVGPVQLTGGSVEIVGDQLRVHRLQAEVMHTSVRADGTWSLAEQTGRASVSWSGQMAEAMNLSHDGEADFQLESITPGRQQITATLRTRGTMDEGEWDAQAELLASGASPAEMTWQLRLPQGAWRDAERTVSFGDSAVEVVTALPTVTLRRARLAGQRISGTAVANLEAATWRADLSTRQWGVPVVDLPAPIDFDLEAEGDPAAAYVRSFKLLTDGLELEADGKYMFGADRPLQAAFRSTVRHEVAADVADGPLAPGDAVPTERQETPFAGRVFVEGELRGSLTPLAITAEGNTFADHLVVKHYRLHDVSTAFNAEVVDDRVTVRTPGYLELLGGEVGFAVRYAMADGTAEVGVQIRDLLLNRMTVYVDPNLDASGTVGATLALSVPEGDFSRMRATGEWQAKELRLGEFVAVTDAEGGLSTRRSLLKLDPISLRYKDGVAEGRAEYDLVQARTVRAVLTVNEWPVNLDEARLATRVNGDVALEIDIVEAGVTGQVDIDTDVVWRDRPVGTVAVAGGLTNQTLTLDRIRADVLDGEIRGSATVRLDDLYASEADIAWENVDLAEAEQWLVWEDELRGRVAGRLQVMPARLARAPEPLQIELTIDPDENTGYRETLLGPTAATLFAGPERYLIHDSSIALADGHLEIWAQAVPREGRLFAHSRVDMRRLDMARLYRTIDPESPPIVGRLSGNVSAFGFTDDPATLAGDGLIRLTQSDLAQTRIIGAVYSAMSLSFGDSESSGAGRVRLRADSGSVRIEEFQYFNRGVDVLGSATIADVSLGGDSPIDGALIGTLRPLRGVDLPFADDIDRMLRTVQAVAGSIRIEGTVREPNPRQATLDDVQSTLSRLLGPQQRE
ncbi:MAG: hypothetical protein WD294_06185 [Phycisphaeraceae bacterium]